MMALAEDVLESALDTISDILDAERSCLRDADYDALPGINARKSEALKHLDRTMAASLPGVTDTTALEDRISTVREKAHRNTQLLGTTLQGARAAAETLAQLRTGEPVNRTYTASGKRQQMLAPTRNTNKMV